MKPGHFFCSRYGRAQAPCSTEFTGFAPMLTEAPLRVLIACPAYIRRKRSEDSIP